MANTPRGLGASALRPEGVLARDRQLSDDVYSAIVQRTAAQGYNPSLITKVPQPQN